MAKQNRDTLFNCMRRSNNIPDHTHPTFGNEHMKILVMNHAALMAVQDDSCRQLTGVKARPALA